MKKIAILFTLIASVVLFAGCASKNPPAADTSASAAATQPAPVKKNKDLKGESI